MATKKNETQDEQTSAANTDGQPVDAPATAAPTTAAPTASEKQPNRNGVTRPRSGTATGRVWEIAEEVSKRLTLEARQKDPTAIVHAPRKDVMQIGKVEGLNEATIATQYGRWRKFYGLGRDQQTAAATPAVATPAVATTEQPQEPVPAAA